MSFMHNLDDADHNNSHDINEVFAQLATWPVDNVSALCGHMCPYSDNSQEFMWHDLAVWGNLAQTYELASVTKILVSLTALIAVTEGAITLEDAAGPPGSTVRHLLSHASGLAQDSTEILTAPGQQRIYSSMGFEVLAQYIAQATQMEFAQYFFEALCEPLGLMHTELYGLAGFGARSTVNDLRLVAQEILRPQLIPPELLDELRMVQFPGLDGFVPGYGKYQPNDWALGLEYHDHKIPHWLGKHQPARTIGHFGQTGTFCWLDCENMLGTIVLCDRDFGTWAKERWSDFNDAVYRSAMHI